MMYILAALAYGVILSVLGLMVAVKMLSTNTGLGLWELPTYLLGCLSFAVGFSVVGATLYHVMGMFFWS